MQLVYQMEAAGVFDISELKLMEEDSKIIGKKQSDDTFDAIKSHINEIDKLIADNLEKWSMDRIAKTDLAIMRVAVAEMMYIDYIPQAVSINEAIKLCKEYSDDSSYRFVNSVLGKIAKSLKSK